MLNRLAHQVRRVENLVVEGLADQGLVDADRDEDPDRDPDGHGERAQVVHPARQVRH